MSGGKRTTSVDPSAEHQKLLSIFDGIDEVVYVSDPDSYEVLYANKAARQQWGPMVGEKCFRVLQQRASPCPFCTNHIIFHDKPNTAHVWEFQNLVNKHWYRCIDRTIRWPDGRKVRYEMAIDITDLKRTEDQLRRSESMYRSLVTISPDAVTLADLNGVIIEASRRTLELHGYEKPEDMVGKSAFDFVEPEEQPRALREYKRILETPDGRLKNLEFTLLKKDGSRFIGEANITLVRDDQGRAQYFLGILRDVTERNRMEETLRALSLTDDLTGLYNRRGLTTLAEQTIKFAGRVKSKVLLLFADFDRLKHINDTLGHPTGDQALKETAALLKETFRQSDIIARIGGDEFAVLALESSAMAAGEIGERLQQNIRARNRERNRRYMLSLSYGLAQGDPLDRCSVDGLLQQADRNMYLEKKSRKTQGSHS